jgi:hypothetical protein
MKAAVAACHMDADFLPVGPHGDTSLTNLNYSLL